MRKPFDMADKYEPLSYQDVPNQFPSFEGNTSTPNCGEDYCDCCPDSTPTVRMQVPKFHPQIQVDGWEDEDTVPSMPNPFHKEEKRYPGVGLMLVVGSGILFWGFLAWLAWH